MPSRAFERRICEKKLMKKHQEPLVNNVRNGKGGREGEGVKENGPEWAEEMVAGEVLNGRLL